MGISKGAVALLYELKQTTPLSGTVCQLGRQDVHLSEDQLGLIANRFGFSATVTGKIGDVQLFESLGFSSVESVDYSDFEHPTHVLDLNQPVPESFNEKYDAIFDGGTLEHVFNFPLALKNIHTMLKPGGLIIHASVSHNHVDHGFYMFSPTVFYDYYGANCYEIVKMYLFEYERDHTRRPWLIYHYTPAAVLHLSFGGWGHKLLGIWCVARKTANSTCDVVPQQNYYKSVWAEKDHGGAPIPNSATRSGAALRVVKSMITGNRFLEPFFRTVWNAFHRTFPELCNRRPPVIARY